MDEQIKNKYKLPEVILVETQKSDKGGFTVVFPEYPGCITYAEHVGELIDVVNDAILTYFEVPREEANSVDFLYVPKTSEFIEEEKEKSHAKKEEPVTEYIQYSPPPFQYA